MSGKRVVIIMAIGILATSTVMYALYFLTRQLDYVSPSEAPEEPAAPHVRLIDPPNELTSRFIYQRAWIDRSSMNL